MNPRFRSPQLPPQFLETYNLILFNMKKSKIKRQWAQEEKKILSDNFPIHSFNKWKFIALKLKESGFSRTELECRQKWINFLDPTLNNQNWNPRELQRMYQMHDDHGNRWCFIQKQLNRTQNSIKNKFYGTIRNYIRFILCTICEKQSFNNFSISKIPPSLLNDIYHSDNVFDFMRGEIKKMIYRMKFCIDKKILEKRVKQRYPIYKQLLIVISNQVKNITSFQYKQLEQLPLTKHNRNQEIIQTKIKPARKRQIKSNQESQSLSKQLNPSETIKMCKNKREQSESGSYKLRESEKHLSNVEAKQQINLNAANQNHNLGMQKSVKDEENAQMYQYQNLQNMPDQLKIKQQFIEQSPIPPSKYYPFMVQNPNFQLFDCYDPILETIMLNNMAQQHASFPKIFGYSQI